MLLLFAVNAFSDAFTCALISTTNRQPRSNKVVFGTYDENDLTQIALNKIGKSVVDIAAIQFLSRTVAGSSGDARKFLELLSRSITERMDSMNEKESNARHEQPLLRVTDVMKTSRASTLKWKDVVETSPANEKLVLCLCTHLASIIRNRPLPLTKLLEICNEVNAVFELETVSELKSILERLVDSGLLKLIDKRIPDNNTIRFDIQLQDVDLAVEDLVMKSSLYSKLVDKLKGLRVPTWRF